MRISTQEATRLAVKAAHRLARDTKAPVLVAVFDVEYDAPDATDDQSRIIVSTQPDEPGNAAAMVQVLYDTMAKDRIKHVCVCGDPNCITLKHVAAAFTES